MRNGLGVAALCCGIVGIFIGLIPLAGIIAMPLGILAIIFGAVSIRRASRGEASKGMAIAGLITGVAALVLSIIGMVIFFSATNNLNNELNKLDSELHNGSTSQVQPALQGVTHQEHQLIRQGVFIGNG
jgi:hypothetical protein